MSGTKVLCHVSFVFFYRALLQKRPIHKCESRTSTAIHHSPQRCCRRHMSVFVCLSLALYHLSVSLSLSCQHISTHVEPSVCLSLPLMSTHIPHVKPSLCLSLALSLSLLALALSLVDTCQTAATRTATRTATDTATYTATHTHSLARRHMPDSCIYVCVLHVAVSVAVRVAVRVAVSSRHMPDSCVHVCVLQYMLQWLLQCVLQCLPECEKNVLPLKHERKLHLCHTPSGVHKCVNGSNFFEFW